MHFPASSNTMSFERLIAPLPRDTMDQARADESGGNQRQENGPSVERETRSSCRFGCLWRIRHLCFPFNLSMPDVKIDSFAALQEQGNGTVRPCPVGLEHARLVERETQPPPPFTYFA